MRELVKRRGVRDLIATLADHAAIEQKSTRVLNEILGCSLVCLGCFLHKADNAVGRAISPEHNAAKLHRCGKQW